MLKRSSFLALLGGLPVALAVSPSLAQSWPGRPLRMIVPWPPGGANDILGRIVAEQIAPRVGQPVVVENRGGANGVLGADALAKSRPDGYTMMFHSVTSHVSNAAIVARLPYDTFADFAPVAMVAAVPMAIVVGPRSPFTTLADLVAAARAEPGRLSFASFGNGSPAHLAGELFARRLGLEMIHVPYRGGAQALTDTISGQVSMNVASLGTAAEMIAAGQVRALAVTGGSRAPALPNVPTVAEAANLPGYDMVVSYAIWAPAGTPADLVGRLAREIEAGLQDPVLQDRFRSQHAVILPRREPDAIRAFITAEAERWGTIARDARVTAE